jgi:hypothetical protein
MNLHVAPKKNWKRVASDIALYGLGATASLLAANPIGASIGSSCTIVYGMYCIFKRDYSVPAEAKIAREAPQPQQVPEAPVPQPVQEAPVPQQVPEAPVPQQVPEAPVPQQAPEAPVPQQVQEALLNQQYLNATQFSDAPQPQQVPEALLHQQSPEDPSLVASENFMSILQMKSQRKIPRMLNSWYSEVVDESALSPIPWRLRVMHSRFLASMDWRLSRCYCELPSDAYLLNFQDIQANIVLRQTNQALHYSC